MIFSTAVLGCIYREKKAMISIYAVFSLVSMAVAAMLFSVAIVGLSSFAELSTSSCQYEVASEDDYMSEYPCCSRRSRCYPDSYDYPRTLPMTHPLSNYGSPECRTIRWQAREIAEEKCRDAVRSSKPATTSVYAILLLVSVIEFIASVSAAVLSFIEVCRGCCKKIDWNRTNRNQQVVYLAFPANGQPGSVPMVLIPSIGPGSPQMAGAVPNMIAPPYPSQLEIINPNMAPGLYPYSMSAVPQGYDPGPQGANTGTNDAMAADAEKREATPPPLYEADTGNERDG